MRKLNMNYAKRISGWMIPMMVLIAVMAGGCSKALEGDLKEMMQTVPAEASVVISGDLNKIAEPLGYKVEDGQIVGIDKGSKIARLMDVADTKEVLKGLKEISSVVELGAFVVFADKGNFYAMANVKDAEKLKAIVDEESKSGNEWEKDGNIEYKDDIFIIDGSRVWVTSRGDVEAIKGYQKLSEVESFLSVEYSKKMISSGDAMNLWGSLSSLYSTLPYSQQAQTRMAVSMLFEKPEFIVGKANFKEGEAEMELMPMTSDYKAAKCVIEMSKIDPKVIDGIGGNANMVMAINISKKLVEQIKEFGNSMGGAIPTEMWDVISPLEGTIAYSGESADNPGKNFKAVVMTNGQNTAPLAQMLEMVGDLNITGKKLSVTNGSYGSGDLKLSDVAKEMKDAWMGVAVAQEEEGTTVEGYFLLEPEDGSLKIVFKAAI